MGAEDEFTRAMRAVLAGGDGDGGVDSPGDAGGDREGGPQAEEGVTEPVEWGPKSRSRFWLALAEWRGKEFWGEDIDVRDPPGSQVHRAWTRRKLAEAAARLSVEKRA
jgi:hypothetical protein